ncbi:stage V sporulation protein AC [uncultured Oscillibacter sp.]|uniref:stage V sporulation protein AC n=1 Tax=uncultured Oscillibacter sp. TaxID=876091 RepID=UPI0025F48221|nr:stage V sporulation protein AC [uncultured Oscillibacter sp.]
MDLSPQEYQAYVKKKAAKSPIVRDTALAFLVGGGICVIGQAIQTAWMASGGLSREDAGTATSCTLVFLSALFTGLNLYQKLARFGGAGTLVPITGFANAVAAPAIDFKSEGYVTGMASRMFQVAGPVIVFGTGAGVVYGTLLMLFGGS